MKILFQGDSITDAGRNREDYHDLGLGYPKYASELIRNGYPDIDFEFVNLGISGDRTDSLVARWQTDAVDIQPDIISILIGINDVWHRVIDKADLPEQAFEDNYRFILTELKNKTKAKIIMLEPYLLYAPLTEALRDDLDKKIQVVRKLAREFADVYIPTDGLFAAASVAGTEPLHWSIEGVHTTDEGARFIAEHYFAAVKKLLG